MRGGTAADLAQIAAIQRSAPEAAQWDCAGYELLVADSDRGLAGFLVWRTIAPDEAEILNLAVALPFRRQGVGLSLIRALPLKDCFLEVRESNVAAQSLYLSAGFSKVGIRYGYYCGPVETAIVMRLQS